MDDVANVLVNWRSQDAVDSLKRCLGSRDWHFIDHKNLDATVRRNTFGDARASPVLIRRWQTPTWVVAACPDGGLGIDVRLIELKPGSSASRQIDGFQIHL